jgi:uncharacterized protein (TIGR00369 family)
MSSTTEETAAVLKQWQQQEAACRTTLGAAGVVPRDELARRSGLEFFAGISAGELPVPPISTLLDFVPIEYEAGRFVFQGTPDRRHYNPIGSVHGGYAATLLDSCVGCAIHSMLPAGKGYTTLELKVNYLRALTDKTGPVRAEGKVIQLGGQVALAEGRITDAAGRLYAFATTTCLIFGLPPAAQ